MEINELVNYATEHNASDIHISSNHPPIFRVNGEIIILNIDKLKAEDIKHILDSVMSDQIKAEYKEFLEVDFAINFNNQRYRVNAFNTNNGPAAVFRAIPSKLRTLKEIGAPSILESLASLHKGLVLVTGPTGSGKSTTIASMIGYINDNFSKHILTIEDPIEFVHQSNKSPINQREVYSNTKSFHNALKSALREDPNVILVGELRDLETIKLALTAAETGHLVLGTLHTNSAALTIDRIIDIFPAEEKEMIRTMLSNSIEGIVSQKLIKRSDGLGRVAAYEVLIANSAVRNLIKEGKILQLVSLMQMNSKSGMSIMKDSVLELQKQGIISNEVAKSVLSSAATSNDSNISSGF